MLDNKIYDNMTRKQLLQEIKKIAGLPVNDRNWFKIKILTQKIIIL